MSLLDRIEKVRNRGDVDLNEYEEKRRQRDRKLELYTMEAKFYVLIADADPEERVELERLIDQTGCFVISVSSGIECLDQITSDKFDLIFIGRNMPRMDGIQTLHEIKKLGDSSMNDDTPVYALTANNFADAAAMYENEGLAKAF